MTSVQAQRKNELFSELMECIKFELINSGFAEEQAVEKAETVTFNIYENWRGLTVVFPMNPERYMEKLKDKILAEFDGKNITEIVRKYKISENILYRWNRTARINKRKANQRSCKNV